MTPTTLTIRRSGEWVIQWTPEWAPEGQQVSHVFSPDTPAREVEVYLRRFGLRTMVVEVES